MHVPINSEVISRKTYKSSSFSAHVNNSPQLTPSGFALSFESQLQLKSLREFADHCRSVLGEIYKDLDDFEMDPQNSDSLSNTMKRLGDICLESDCRGIYSLYDVAFALQRILLESGYRIGSPRLWNTFNKGLAILLALIEECEADYRRELAVDDLLASLH